MVELWTASAMASASLSLGELRFPATARLLAKHKNLCGRDAPAMSGSNPICG